ncbi:MAG TPA: DNA-3-methyladenine glycosylase [Candidatus Dormibacteraeota bacterium]
MRTRGSTARSAGTTGNAAASEPLPLAWYERDTLEVARDLLGKVLVRTLPDGRALRVRLVEVEAYCGPDDLAAHSSRGLTPRTRVMFGPAGHAYVYLIYGVWHCLNFVTRPAGFPQAVLIRAGEPLTGEGRCSGPGLLCRSLQIDRALNGSALLPPAIYVEDDGFRPEAVFTTPRIGVEYSGEWSAKPWRFCLDSPALSRRLTKPRAAG